MTLPTASGPNSRISLPIDRLPIDEMEPQIHQALNEHRNLVLVAAPGAGKTTRFPVSLLRHGDTNLRIAVLEPRRLAARAAAVRIAQENENLKLGCEIGYSVRFESTLGPNARIAFFTEGLFLHQLKSNPTLTGYSAVVLDEFHERSRHTDLALGLLSELQALDRPDLRIIVMSATIDAERISSFLKDPASGKPAPIVVVPGRTHAVDVHYTKEPLSLATDRVWIERNRKFLDSILKEQVPSIGDILVFLPGVGEIRRLKEALASTLAACNFDSAELHGQLTLEEQSTVLRKRSERRRVILATNIAETSLTIDGVGTVVDTGLARVSRLDRLGFPQLELERISKASAKQRGGRAGRQFPGLNYRLWSRLDENSFPDFDEPELMRTDLSEPLLELIGLNAADPRTFTWFEPPPAASCERGLDLLKALGAINQDLQLTSLGKRMLATNASPRLARILADGPNGTPSPTRALIATLLQERDFILEPDNLRATHECDLFARAEFHWSASERGRIDRNSLQTQKRVYQSFADRPSSAVDWDFDAVEAIVAMSYPDRICRRRRPAESSAKMVGGKGVEISPKSLVQRSEFFIALRGEAASSRLSRDPIATLATPISRSTIERLFPQHCQKTSKLVFEESNRTVYRETALSFHDLQLETGNRERPLPDEALPLLLKWAREHWDDLLSEDSFSQLKRRIEWYQAHVAKDSTAISQGQWQELFEESAEEELYGKTSAQNLNLTESFQRVCDRQIPGLLGRVNSDAPAYFQAPTGSRVTISYSPNQSPSIEIRLQELFGLKTHPAVGGGRYPLTLHLLGPNYRPVQVTSDLPGFWKGTYFDVRKDLKARYPKHSWPDHPENAAPEAKGSRRR